MSNRSLRTGWSLIIAAALILSYSAVTASPAPAHAGSAPRPPAPDWGAPHVARQLLVKLSDASAASANEAGAAAALAGAGLRVIRTIPQLNLALAETSAATDLAAAAERAEAQPGIEWAEPNYTFALDSTDFVPNDPYYASPQAAYLSRLQMPAAWDITTGKPEVVVAVLDTGLDMTHPDLLGGVWENAAEKNGRTGVDDDGNGFVDDVNGWNFPDDNGKIYDDHGHGTHVAGTIAARINNGIGIAGMAGNVTIMPVDVFGGGIGAYEDLIRAIIYATDNGARVINMSLGASSYSLGEAMAVNYAVDHGVVTVAAAGNTGNETYHYPAAHPAVIAVAATTASDTRASFSTRGDWVDVAAPGVSIYATFPGGRYIYMSGTSMATPHVSGLAALILSVNPALNPAAVRGIIESTVDDLGALGRDIDFGWGRINAGRALAQVTPGSAPTETPPPPLAEWPTGCTDLITDGNFEAGPGAWQLSGDVRVDATRAYTGTNALHFLGGANTSGVVSRTITLPAEPLAGTLWFAYRIEDYDSGMGTNPAFPYDDSLTASFVVTRAGAAPVKQLLLTTGNMADTAFDGLPWDRYLYRMQAADFSPLLGAGPVELVFQARNDSDSQPTDFWVDFVRLCVTGTGEPSATPTPTASLTPTATETPTPTATATPTLRLRHYLPLIWQIP